MKIYECIKEMCIPKCDGDGFTIENEYGFVDVGSKWYEDGGHSVIGGEVHLECMNEDEDLGWIEISNADLKECFKEVEK